MSDDLPWSGPACPTCGRELDAETVGGSDGVTVAYVCSEHGAVALTDPFD